MSSYTLTDRPFQHHGCGPIVANTPGRGPFLLGRPPPRYRLPRPRADPDRTHPDRALTVSPLRGKMASEGHEPIHPLGVDSQLRILDFLDERDRGIIARLQEEIGRFNRELEGRQKSRDELKKLLSE